MRYVGLGIGHLENVRSQSAETEADVLAPYAAYQAAIDQAALDGYTSDDDEDYKDESEDEDDDEEEDEEGDEEEPWSDDEDEWNGRDEYFDDLDI